MRSHARSRVSSFPPSRRSLKSRPTTIPDSHRHAALRSNAGCNDACRVDAALQACPDAADIGQGSNQGNRAADLSGQLLSQQSAARAGVLRDAHGTFWRASAADDGRAGHAAGGRPKDRKSRHDPGVQEPREHLRRHARPPHLEPLGGCQPTPEHPSVAVSRTVRVAAHHLYLVTGGRMLSSASPRCGVHCGGIPRTEFAEIYEQRRSYA